MATARDLCASLDELLEDAADVHALQALQGCSGLRGDFLNAFNDCRLISEMNRSTDYFGRLINGIDRL